MPAEAIHGVYVGLLAQEIYRDFDEEEKNNVDKETYSLLKKLMKNECIYTEELYANIELDHEVKQFLKYNANKALMNLGKDVYYEHEEINPIVLNGLNTESKTHDFFSVVS